MSQWLSVDPLWESWINQSPYNYVFNNPVRLTDPTGMGPQDIKVVDSEGNHLFTLDDGKEEVTVKTVKELYDEGVQWFEPEANNYIPLKSIEPSFIGSQYKGAVHTSFRSLVEFSVESNRSPLAFLRKFSGDWKLSKKGGDGFLLAEVDGKPYWTDAIGQIPFAIDTYEYYLRNYYGDKQIAEAGYRYNVGFSTLKTGADFANGLPYIGSDHSKSYDNLMIMRVVNWAETNMHQFGGEMNTWSEHTRGIEMFSKGLGNPVTAAQF